MLSWGGGGDEGKINMSMIPPTHPCLQVLEGKPMGELAAAADIHKLDLNMERTEILVGAHGYNVYSEVDDVISTAIFRELLLGLCIRTC